MSPQLAGRVLIVGGGVAGLEALLALSHLAGDRVRLTLLLASDEFVYRPIAMADPFCRGRVTRRRITQIAAGVGAELVHGRIAAVDAPTRTAITTAGDELACDALLVAVGARSGPVLRGALTWTPDADAELLGGLLRDLEEGYTKQVAFVVPPGVTWTLPAYELALMTASQAWSMGQDDVEVTIYTPEDAPLAQFGPRVAAAARRDLKDAGVRVRTGVCVLEDVPTDGRLVLHPGELLLEAGRVITLPQPIGPRLPGLPCDDQGFVPVDQHGRVSGLDGVWAAGDMIAFAVKQGGLAIQQADAAAESIAVAFGAELVPQPFAPVPRTMMLTEPGRRWMRDEPADGDRDGAAAQRTPSRPPAKIAGRYLAPYLAALDGTDPAAGAPPADDPINLDLDLKPPRITEAPRRFAGLTAGALR